jgi:hypothetical protein
MPWERRLPGARVKNFAGAAMKRLLSHLAGRLLAADLLSSGLSAAALAWRGRAETGSAAAPVNAISHWLWARQALRQDGVSARYTLAGLGVHFAAALLWCGLYEPAAARRRERMRWPTPLPSPPWRQWWTWPACPSG